MTDIQYIFVHIYPLIPLTVDKQNMFQTLHTNTDFVMKKNRHRNKLSLNFGPQVRETLRCNVSGNKHFIAIFHKR